jgi:hypothetical protein
MESSMNDNYAMNLAQAAARLERAESVVKEASDSVSRVSAIPLDSMITISGATFILSNIRFSDIEAGVVAAANRALADSQTVVSDLNTTIEILVDDRMNSIKEVKDAAAE